LKGKKEIVFRFRIRVWEKLVKVEKLSRFFWLDGRKELT